MDKIKVCHFTSVHPADDIRIFYKECISLAEAGYEDCLVATNTQDIITLQTDANKIYLSRQGLL